MDKNRNIIKKSYNIRKITYNQIIHYFENINLVTQIKVINYVRILNVHILKHEIDVKRYTYEYNLPLLLTTNKLDPSFIDSLIYKILKSTSLMNKLNIVNGNINPNNILFDENYELYISDYCLNEIRDINYIIDENYKYLSPETILYNKYTMKSDIWSIGLIIYRILNNKNLLKGNNKEEIEECALSIENKDIEIEDEFIKYKSIIKSCLKIYEDDRILIDDIMLIIKKDEIDYDDEKQYTKLYNSIGFFKFDEIIKKIKRQEVIKYDEIKYICNEEDIIKKLIKHSKLHNSIYDFCILTSMKWESNDRFYYNNYCKSSMYDYNSHNTLNILKNKTYNYFIIDLSDQYYFHLSLTEFIDVFQYFKYFSNVQYINLRGQKIGDVGAMLVIDNFEYFECLKDLDISGIEMTNDPVEHISKRKILMPNLEILKMSNNNFNKMITKYIRLAIPYLPKCDKIYIDGFKEEISTIVSLQKMFPTFTFRYPRIN